MQNWGPVSVACVKQVTGVPGITLWSTGDRMCPWSCYYFSNTQEHATGTTYGPVHALPGPWGLSLV